MENELIKKLSPVAAALVAGMSMPAWYWEQIRKAEEVEIERQRMRQIAQELGITEAQLIEIQNSSF
jgi:RNA-splicing ligase RtcB